MARPLVLAVCLVLGLARGAWAGGRTSKVSIETDPPGAKVYLNVKEDGEVCTTPCTIDAPIGETPIIVEAENRRSIIENLIVPKKTARPMRVSYKLKPAVGTLIIDGGDGAAIAIDDESQGTAPRRFEDILAGAHHVVVLEKKGKTLYDKFVEVEIGREVTVSLPRLAAEPPPTAPASEVPAVSASRSPGTTAPGRAPSFAITVTTDIGFRQFNFNYPSATSRSTQKNDREAGEVLTGGIIELWPTTLLSLGVLPGLALYGRFALGVNPQSVTFKNKTGQVMATTLSTAWRNVEISARQRWTIASAGAVEVSAGYIVDRYEFTSDDPAKRQGERAIVPNAAYKAVRIGGRVSLLVDRFEPYLAAENRVMLSGGVLEHRYELGGSANGYHGAVGAALHLGHFEVRAEGSLTLYSWTFQPGSQAEDEATSGRDLIEKISLALGYVY